MRLASVKECPTSPKLLTFDAGTDLVGLARDELSHHDHFRYHSNSIAIESQDGRLVITGRLPSFYLKQVLQTVLRALPEVQQIDNRIDVVSCHGLSSTQDSIHRSART
ncbi:MAG: BON domain-containing protein [Planctomycetes bacterium]|nr:BON domain-containing protein [Planctomycetota bacterium]